MTPSTRVKIDKRFVFSLHVLRDYVRNNWRNSTTQYEILAALTISKVFEDEKSGEYYVYFPLKSSHEKRFPTDRRFFSIEDFFKLFHDGNASEDIFLLRKEGKHYAVIPLQIKRYGVGRWKTGSTQKIISFLEEKSHYTPSEMQFIMILEDIPATSTVVKDLSNASKWLKEHDFPFKGVIVVHPLASGEMIFCQLKPSRGQPAMKKFTKDQIINQ